MYKIKRITAIVLALILAVTMAVPVFAAEPVRMTIHQYPNGNLYLENFIADGDEYKLFYNGQEIKVFYSDTGVLQYNLLDPNGGMNGGWNAFNIYLSEINAGSLLIGTPIVWQSSNFRIEVYKANELVAYAAFSTNPAKDIEDIPPHVYEEAILYKIRDADILEFNGMISGKGTYTADISGAQIVDETDSGIATLDDLKAVMGTPDAPARVLGTDVGVRTLGKAVTANLEIKDDQILSVTITNVRERPVLGITWKDNFIGTDYAGFAEAFERNGALAVFLPQVYSAEGAQDVLSKLDGIFVTGGEDWNPYLYNPDGMTPYGSSGWNNARDTSDLNLMQQAIAMDVPMLMVCRGHQGFNIAMGGGLIQDIPYYLWTEVEAGRIDPSRVTSNIAAGNWAKRTLSDPNDIYSSAFTTTVPDWGARKVQVDGIVHSGGTRYHKLENTGIDTNSKWLYDIIGNTTMDYVATAHHQAVDPEYLGEGLTIVARSSDGIVEAMEHQDSLFALSVQWHPERDGLTTSSGIVGLNRDESNALLRALVSYAGIYADKTVNLTTSAAYVFDGDEITVDGAFFQEENTNTVVATFTWDPDVFEYVSYRDPESPTLLVTWEPLNLDTIDGSLKVVLMNKDYGIQDLGSIVLKAKDGQETRETSVGLSASYIGWEGEKKVEKAGETSKTIMIVGSIPPPIPTLIQLSNLIDWIGYNTSIDGWYAQYVYYDFNKNGVIDIFDIAYLASLIL